MGQSSKPKLKRARLQTVELPVAGGVLWRDNDEYSKSAEKEVIGSEEDADETHDEEEEDQDVIPNFEIVDDNGDEDGLDSEYENELIEDEVLQRLWILKT